MLKSMRNIEIKARVNDFKKFENCVEKIAKLTTVLRQTDYFFNVDKTHSFGGRLKLRVEKERDNKKAYLVFYKRPNVSGPKLCDYTISPINDPETLRTCLDAAWGTSGIVDKIRHLYMYDQTRIHVDYVTNLGYFMELEVVLRPEQITEEGQAIAENIMKLLDIQENDLINVSYFDLLQKVPISVFQ